MRAPSAYRQIAAAAARRYANAGRFAQGYAAGKLRHDPVFAAVLAQGLIPRHARLVDLGCGRGLLFALLIEAGAAAQGAWPAAWAPPPQPVAMTGFDVAPRAVALARRALGTAARIDQADLRSVALPPCDAIALFDVLHYVEAPAQEAALARCAQALTPGGVLLLRVNDAGARWRFALTRSADQLATLARTRSWPRLHCRPSDEWIGLLERTGFRVAAQAASAGTPFANALLVARRG